MNIKNQKLVVQYLLAAGVTHAVDEMDFNEA